MISLGVRRRGQRGHWVGDLCRQDWRPRHLAHRLCDSAPTNPQSCRRRQAGSRVSPCSLTPSYEARKIALVLEQVYNRTLLYCQRCHNL